MKIQLVIFAGLGIFTLMGASADSGPTAIGRYQIVGAAQSNNAWRIDTATGQIEYCIAMTEAHQLPDCYAARMQSKTPYSP